MSLRNIVIALALCLAMNATIGGGGATASQGRAIPWDCSDWQSFAHEDRTTAILESLAENRGKTLYCGVDQSDTFAKAETWAAGKDRNERDDTIYSGERGIFRGFIAAQEGWLTDGESGVTGVSIDRIFEFPREKKKRRRYKTVVTERLEVAADNARLLYTDFGQDSSQLNPESSAKLDARERFANPIGGGPGVSYNWQTLADAAARAYCQEQGYNRVAGVAPSPEASEGWDYGPNTSATPGFYRFQARKTNTWTATCEKTERRRR